MAPSFWARYSALRTLPIDFAPGGKVWANSEIMRVQRERRELWIRRVVMLSWVEEGGREVWEGSGVGESETLRLPIWAMKLSLKGVSGFSS